MTTDQVLTLSDQEAETYCARAIKYKAELSKLRVLEKLEIERRYWLARRIDWGIVRECDVPKSFVANVKWVRPYFQTSDLYPLSGQAIRSAALRLTKDVLITALPLSEIASACDARNGLANGSSLAIVRHLIATKLWQVDFHQLINPREPLILLRVHPGLLRSLHD